jgi:RecG-like helicase
MKKIISLIALTGLITALAIPAFAGGKEVTITGEGKCAKCALHETDKCQNVIQTQENGKTVTYYLAHNSVSKEFHDNICKESKKITVTGTVKEKDGKKTLTPTKIELAK